MLRLISVSRMYVRNKPAPLNRFLRLAKITCYVVGIMSWVRRASRKHLRVVPTKLPARGKTRMENIKHYAAKRQGTACTSFSTNALHHPQTKEQPPPASPARRNKLSFKYKLLPVCTRYFHPSGKHQNTGTTTNTISTKERTPVGAEAHGTKHAMKSCN